MNVLKRKYNSEVPDNAFYRQPTPSMPARRTQMKINPEGKTTFGPEDLIRIHIPAQGYLDPEFSYLSFDIKIQCPDTYCMKALELWNRGANSSLVDTGFNSIMSAGKGGTIDGTPLALPVPVLREKQIPTTAQARTADDFLYEYVPVGQVYPVLPYSTHGFFNRVVIRSANNTPLEDIQDYDYLSATLGQLLHSEPYEQTMGTVLEGWGNENTRAKLGISCIENLQYIRPAAFLDVSNSVGVKDSPFVYSYTGTYSAKQPVQGLSPEGVPGEVTGESFGGLKFTCNLNLGLLQTGVHLPLLFSGGMIIELYTNSFERAFSFKSIYGRLEATDFPGVADSGILNGNHGECVDVTAQACKLPGNLTSSLGWAAESATSSEIGRFFNVSNCPYALSNTIKDTGNNATNLICRNDLLNPSLSSGYTGGGQVKLSDYAVQTYSVVDDTGAATQSGPNNLLSHFTSNAAALEARYKQFLNTSEWSYTLENVEFRADMLQYSQAYDEGTADVVDRPEGLPITFQTFATQKTLYNGARQTLTMNERARAIQYALAVFKNPEAERKAYYFLPDNDSRITCAADWMLPASATNGGITENGFGLKDVWTRSTSKPNFYEATSLATYGLETEGTAILMQYRPYVDSTTQDRYPDDKVRAGPCIYHSFSRRKFATFANPWNIIARIVPIDAQQESFFPELIDYQFRIGTRFIPASPVDCSRGAVQAYIELMKSIGLYGTFTGDRKNLAEAGNAIRPEQYSKRICTDSRVTSGAYATSIKAGFKFQPIDQSNTTHSRDYFGCRFRTPSKFILGQNFSDITEFASGIDTATQALSIELALNGNIGSTSGTNIPTQLACYVFLNVRRDMYIRCGGQIEILY